MIEVECLKEGFSKYAFLLPTKIIGMAQMKIALTRCSRSTRQRIINKSDGTAKTRLPTVQEFSGLLPVMRRQE